MRKHLVAGLVVAALTSGAGCYDLFSDPLIFHVGGIDEMIGTGGTGGSGGTGGTSGECVPSDENPVVDGSCGVFVSASGSDAAGEGDGTKEKPYQTLGKAIAEGAGRIYACANGAKPFDEAVEPSADVEIYGALDCTNGWAYDPSKKSAWTAPADTIPLAVGGDAKVEVYDFALTARDAEKAGGSSLAVLVWGESAELVLERCDVAAGNGKDGEAGTTPAGVGVPGPDGQRGDDGDGDPQTMGMTCTSTEPAAGGQGGQSSCAGVDTSGGNGGTGTADVNGDPGGAGNPFPGPMPNDGLGGAGDDGTGCEPGQSGAKGEAGPSGAGASGLGELTAAGYVGSNGQDGQGPGTPGQGGGGGGGAKTCDGTNAGPGGGGGGAGGCGGAPGTGGKAGGASIGVASVNAKSVTLAQVTITTAKGGAGGKGGNGQPGGDGGSAGQKGGSGACGGGFGGQGGRGGSAGGGLGGPSWGVAVKGTLPVQTDVKITAGGAGAGGLGGDNNTALSGEDGTSCQERRFDEGECVK